MSFLCNSCFTCMEKGRMPGGPCILTSCYHILCNACSHRISNNQCTTCAKQCRTVIIGKDMPLALKAYFEPPMPKIENIQQQFKFLKQQQQINFKVKAAVELKRKKNKLRVKTILDMDNQTTGEAQRLQLKVKQMADGYGQMREKYHKLKVEEMQLRQLLEKMGYPVDKDYCVDDDINLGPEQNIEK